MSWRKTREYRIWRAEVIRRDKVCQVCGSRNHRHAHHIDHASYFPEKRYDAGNGICLCSKCHSQYHSNFHRSTREKCTRYTLDNFKQLVKYFKEIFNGAK